MALDQNQILKDLRPLNLTPKLPDETRIAPPTSRNVEAFYANPPGFEAGSPGAGTVFYQATVSDGGFVGLGYPNAIAGIASPWCQPVPVTIGHPGSAVGFNYAGNWVAGNAADRASSDNLGAGVVYSPNLVNQVGDCSVDQLSGNSGTGFGSSLTMRATPNLVNQVGDCSVDQLSSNSGTGFGSSPTMRALVGSNGTDRGNEGGGGGDDSASEKKVKFLCSFGGKILPRPSDGMLRYVGGHTRIISVKRDASFGGLVRKMADTYGQPVVIKYQLPDEDLDALVSVSCVDDLKNMMDEYEKLVERSPDGSAKLRVFLFSASELDSPGTVKFADFQDNGQKYVEAVNGVVDGGITRKESMTCATSTQNLDLSVNDAVDSSGIGQSDAGSQSAIATTHDASPRFTAVGVDPNHALQSCIPVVETGPLQTSSVPQSTHYMHGYVDPRQEMTNHTMFPSQMGFPNAQLFGDGRPIFTQQQFCNNAFGVSTAQFMPAVHITMTPSSCLVGMGPNVMQQQHTQLDQNYNAYQSQVPSAMVGRGYVWSPHVQQPEHVVFSNGLVPHQVTSPEKIPRLDDCYMCQKALPHAHSDTVVQDKNGGVATSPVSDSNMVFHSLRLEDQTRAWPMSMGLATRAMGEGNIDQGAAYHSRVLGHMDQQVGTPQPEANGFPQNLNHPKTSIFLGSTGLACDVQSPYGVNVGGIPHSFQDSTLQQNLMPTQYQVKPEAMVSRPVKTDASTVAVLATQTPEALVHESPRKYPGKLPGVVAEEDVIDGRMETLQTRPPNILVNNERSTSPIDELRKEGVVIKPQQATGQERLLDTAFSKPQMVLDAEAMIAPNVSNSGPLNHLDPLGNRVNIVVSGVESTYVMDNIPPVSEWRDDTSKVILGGGEAFPSNGNLRSSSSPSSRADDSQDFSPSLFSNQDPWNMQQEAHFLPLRPNKVLTKKETFYTPFGDNNLVNGGELLAEMLLDDRAHQPLGNSDMDCDPDRSRTIKAEELIKQELKATAEGVAANVLQTTLSSDLDLPAQRGNESASEANGDCGFASSVEMQHKTIVEDIKIKVPEKIKFAYPVSDGLGRLQIIKNDDLEELQELGSGTFGTVYHGKWRGTDVAIKRINDRCFAGKASEQERMRDDFWNEAIKLADLHHPNVVAFYGVVLDGPGGSVATVTEYMVNGSLRNALQRNERNLDKRKRLLIAMDVAFGMEYLHGKNIVHFDLKSDNLLVNLRDPHRPICKVGDLGLSKVKCQTLISGGVRGTLPWMAPELLNGSSSLVSDKVDVFSFGIVLWELLTGEEPYADLHYGAIIGGIVSNTLRPPIPKSCDQEWRSLMERCWAAEPAERPSFTEIADELRSMAAKLPPRGQAQQKLPPRGQAQQQQVASPQTQVRN